MLLENKIAGVIILYNPSHNTIKNIISYIDLLDHLFVIDNSEIPDRDIIDKILMLTDNISYQSFGKNLGIATALNTGCELSLTKGYEWILTMDQDSIFYEDNLYNLIQSIKLVDANVTGIITPDHVTSITINRNDFTQGTFLRLIKNCMTSGNLLNLKIWDTAGRFKDEFFIDFVDHEFCLRLNKNGYLIYLCTKSVLIHQLGDGLLFKWLNMQLSVTNHNYIRRYYMTRNRLWCLAHYFFTDTRICIKEIYSILAELFKIILKEEDKYKKLRSFFEGTRDFLLGKFGKYNKA